MNARELADVLGRVEQLEPPDPDQLAAVEEFVADNAPEGFGEGDFLSLQVCNLHGHAFEGQLRHPPTLGRRLFGRCARCGFGIITDGS